MNNTFIRKIVPLILIVSSFGYGFIEGPSPMAIALCFVSVFIGIILNPQRYNPHKSEVSRYSSYDPIYKNYVGNSYYGLDDRIKPL